jgi:MerR family mercuric resistance operon transcriptional regulator
MLINHETLSVGQSGRTSNIETAILRAQMVAARAEESGYREYSPEDVFRIKFIKRAQELGFTLKEISELLDLRVDSKTTCAKVKKQADSKISDIEEKIRLLKKMKAALGKLASSCQEHEPHGGCPILEYLNEQGKW